MYVYTYMCVYIYICNYTHIANLWQVARTKLERRQNKTITTTQPNNKTTQAGAATTNIIEIFELIAASQSCQTRCRSEETHVIRE